MARTRQTDIAVLGGLSVEPMTGYQLRAAISEVLGHFWHESYGQIYPCLGRLVTEGLVRADDGPRTASKVYTITAAGRAELRRQLSCAPEMQQPRNALLLRVFFGARMEPEVLARMLDDYELELRERLRSLTQAREGMVGDPLAEEHGRYWLATISAGEHGIRSQLQWLVETRDALFGAGLTGSSD